jgi:hypothetical protein
MGPKADESLLCSVCRRVLPARAFSIDNSRPSGRQRTCRECVPSDMRSGMRGGDGFGKGSNFDCRPLTDL